MFIFSPGLNYFARKTEVTLTVFFQNGTLETVSKQHSPYPML